MSQATPRPRGSKVSIKIACLRNASDKDEPVWAFACDPHDDQYHEVTEVWNHFKIYLDQRSFDLAREGVIGYMSEAFDEVKYLVTDYLYQICKHVKLCIENAMGVQKEKNIEFVFSLPTI